MTVEGEEGCDSSPPPSSECSPKPLIKTSDLFFLCRRWRWWWWWLVVVVGGGGGLGVTPLGSTQACFHSRPQQKKISILSQPGVIERSKHCVHSPSSCLLQDQQTGAWGKVSDSHYQTGLCPFLARFTGTKSGNCETVLSQDASSTPSPGVSKFSSALMSPRRAWEAC